LAVVYTAAAEWRRTGPLAGLVVGRQQSSHGLPVTFDGGAIDLRFFDRRLTLFALGGQTVHFFQTRPGFFENWLVGGGAGFRLDPNLHIEADSRFLHEIILGSAGVTGERVNTHSYGLALMGRWDDLQAKLFCRGMNRTFSHVGGTFRLRMPAAGMGIDGQATTQLVTLGEIAESESPFFAVLGNSLPFLRARLETWKEFHVGDGGVVAVAVGTRFRQLLRDQPTSFNRNMNALYARMDLTDNPFKGAFASVSVDWNMPTQPDDSTRFFTVGGSAGYTARMAKAELGTYFQRFKVNYYRDVEELTEVRTVYAMGSYRVLSHVEIRARYLVEVVDRTVQSVFLTLREDI
jgi:hypothetical protein